MKSSLCITMYKRQRESHLDMGCGNPGGVEGEEEGNRTGGLLLAVGIAAGAVTLCAAINRHVCRM